MRGAALAFEQAQFAAEQVLQVFLRVAALQQQRGVADVVAEQRRLAQRLVRFNWLASVQTLTTALSCCFHASGDAASAGAAAMAATSAAPATEGMSERGFFMESVLGSTK